MEISSDVTCPESSERDRLPTLTCRPRAPLNSDSSFGRNEFASIKNGTMMTMTIRTPTTMPRIFRPRFMDGPSCRSALRTARAAAKRRVSLLVVQEFGRWHAAAFHFFLACSTAFIVETDRGFELFLALFFAAHANQNLPAQVMNVGAAGIGVARGVNRA